MEPESREPPTSSKEVRRHQAKYRQNAMQIGLFGVCMGWERGGRRRMELHPVFTRKNQL